jgi:branched-chain amino acid transport system ATP-binding protein
MPQLLVSDVTAGYGQIEVLSNVDLHADTGEYVCIIGPNGAGKSTLIKTIYNLTTLFSGSIQFNNVEISDVPAHELVRKGISYVPQTNNVFPPLTVKENLKMGAYSLDGDRADRYDQIYEYFPALAEIEDTKAGMLSGGQQKMLALGRALMVEPALLLLDEPSAGLAPDLVEQIFDHLDEINDAGITIIVVEQNAEEALNRAERGYVLTDGENQYEGPSDEIIDDEEIRREFLGL